MEKLHCIEIIQPMLCISLQDDKTTTTYDDDELIEMNVAHIELVKKGCRSQKVSKATSIISECDFISSMWAVLKSIRFLPLYFSF